MMIEALPTQCYVIKSREISALNFIAPPNPRPCNAEWIDRGSNKPLRPSSVQQLLRTGLRKDISPSVAKLHDHAGLRLVFESPHDRNYFVREFQAALVKENDQREHLVTAIFKDREVAKDAISRIIRPGMPAEAFCILWQDADILTNNLQWPSGHEKLSVSLSTAGGGLLGAMFGIALFSIPGIGPVAAAGIVAASTFPSLAAVSGILGATGGALTKMLSDFDVDGLAKNLFEREVRQGKAFVAVDERLCDVDFQTIQGALLEQGGKQPLR